MSAVAAATFDWKTQIASSLASLLPDQLRQTPDGMQTLLRVARHSSSLDLDAVCQTVDGEQMKLAECYEIPNHLSQLLEQARRTMTQTSL